MTSKCLKAVHTILPVSLLLASLVPPVVANVALPFDKAAADAPFIMLIRVHSADADQLKLDVVETLKGTPPSPSLILQRPEWLYRPLKPNHQYVVLLAEDSRPYVGPLTPDSDPDKQVPAFGCGTINVLEVIDGAVHDFYDFVKKPDGSAFSYEDLKQQIVGEN